MAFSGLSTMNWSSSLQTHLYQPPSYWKASRSSSARRASASPSSSGRSFRSLEVCARRPPEITPPKEGRCTGELQRSSSYGHLAVGQNPLHWWTPKSRPSRKTTLAWQPAPNGHLQFSPGHFCSQARAQSQRVPRSRSRLKSAWTMRPSGAVRP